MVTEPHAGNIDDTTEVTKKGGLAGRTVLIFAVVFVVVIVGSFLATFAVRGGFSGEATETASVQVEEFANLPSDPNTPATAPVTITGDPLPAYDLQAASDPAVGQTFPELSGINFSGKPVTIRNDGRPKVIVVLAHYSPVANQFVLDLDKWLEENSTPDGVDVYGVSTKANPEKANFPPGTWLRVNGWPFFSETLVDSDGNEIFDAVGGPGVPFFIVVDANGKVVGRTVGNLTGAGFDQLLEAARTGSLDVNGIDRTAAN
jgi:hypothetical protein